MYYFWGMVAIFVVMGWAIYLNFRNGQLNMGPLYTMAIGAYFSGYATTEWGWPIILASIVAVAMGSLAAFIPGLALARAPSFAVSIATIGIIFVTQTVIRNFDFLGGPLGLFGIPRPGYWLPIMWIIVLVLAFWIYRLDHSRSGRSFEMIAVDEDLATILGVNSYKQGVLLQTLSGTLGALAGVMYAFFSGALVYKFFGFALLLRIVCFLFVGGISTMWGVLIFTPVLFTISVFLPSEIAQNMNVIYGALLLVILVLRPKGVIDRQTVRMIGQRISSLFSIRGRPEGVDCIS
jgi:branched-chain amino acid transport system permease protein